MNPGDILGNYRIDRLLGEDDIGMVYQATDLSTQREVALKVIYERFSRESNFRERFSREAHIATELDHPGLIKVFDFGQYKDQLYIVMEYISGVSMRQHLDNLHQEQKRFPLNEAVLLVRQLCQTLDYAHRHGVLHRDIKPANLIRKSEDTGKLPFRVVLTDLGLSGGVVEQGITQDEATLNTLAYMSPEQMLGKIIESSSGVYSLGILLYELAVGILPFPIKTVTDAILAHTKEPPPDPHSVRPELPEALVQVILKALEKDPGLRFAEVVDLEVALAGVAVDSTEIIEPIDREYTSLEIEYKESLDTALDVEKTSLMNAFEPGSTQVQSAIIPGFVEGYPKIQIDIQVFSKGRKPQIFSFSAEKVTIGRGQDNQIVLDDPEISRRHIQITCDGSNYYVTDLRSRNGTYLDKMRIQPDIPKIWSPDQEVIIGRTTLRLISKAQPEPVINSARAELVQVLVTPQQLAVEPGESISAAISLINSSPHADYFSIMLNGIPNNWIVSLPSRVHLNPGKQKEIALNLQIPRNPQSRAGRRPIILRVISQRDPSRSVEVKLTLTIAAYSEFRAELRPQFLQAGQTGQLSISNQGNLPEIFSVRFTDIAGVLSFHPPQLQMRVPEGKSAIAEFRGQPREKRWLGGEKSHSFSAQVSLPQREPQILHAEMLSRGAIPFWMIPTVMLFCLLFVGSIAALWYFFRPMPTVVDTVITSKLLNGNSVTFTFTTAEGGTEAAGFECSLDSDIFTDCASPISYSNLTDASHTFEVRAKDAAGNVDQSPDSFTWTLDTTSLNTIITSMPMNLSNSDLATFIFSGTVGEATITTFECQLDGGAFTACTSPTSYPNLIDGPHTFQVRAKDSTGNIDQFPASFSWMIDTTPPETTITVKPSNSSNSPTFSFTGTGVSFECKLDDGPFTACASPVNYPALPDGPHFFQVRARDEAGNIDQSPESFLWTINVMEQTAQAQQTQVAQQTAEAQLTQTVQAQQTQTAEAQQTLTAQAQIDEAEQTQTAQVQQTRTTEAQETQTAQTP